MDVTSPNAKAEQLIAQHLSVMLVLGKFTYFERIEFAKRSASITVRTAKESSKKTAPYWSEVQKFIDNYTIS